MRKRRSIIVCCAMACLLSGCGKEAPQIIDLNATTEQSVSTMEVSTDIDPDPGHVTRTEASTEPLTEQRRGCEQRRDCRRIVGKDSGKRNAAGRSVVESLH